VTFPAPLDYLSDNMDGQGLSTRGFLTKMADSLLRYGSVLIGADMPEMETALESLADAIAMGAFPYPLVIDPQNVLFWENDRHGFSRLHLQENFDDGSQSILMLTREFWQRFTKKSGEREFKPGPSKPNPLGIIPYKMVTYPESVSGFDTRGLGDHLIDIAIDRLNLLSLVREIEYNQGFATLWAEGGADEYGRVTEEGETDLSVLGTSSIACYPEGRACPQYVSPDSAHLDKIQADADRSARALNYIGHMDSLLGEQTMQAAEAGASGISKAFTFLNTNEALKNCAAQVAFGFKTTMEFCSYWLNSNNGFQAMEAAGAQAFDQTSIVFADDFGVVDINDLKLMYEIEAQYIRSDAMKSEITRKFLASKMPGISSDILKKILIESEEARTDMGAPNQSDVVAAFGNPAFKIPNGIPVK